MSVWLRNWPAQPVLSRMPEWRRLLEDTLIKPNRLSRWQTFMETSCILWQRPSPLSFLTTRTTSWKPGPLWPSSCPSQPYLFCSWMNFKDNEIPKREPNAFLFIRLIAFAMSKSPFAHPHLIHKNGSKRSSYVSDWSTKINQEKPRVYPYHYPTIHQRWENRCWTRLFLRSHSPNPEE